MTQTTYQRIRYPDVGESVSGFENYKVFLKHWDGLGEILRSAFEVVKTRQQTKVIVLYGEQGVGKTIFAERLENDLEASASSLGRSELNPNSENLWHRISGGSSLQKTLIDSATRDSAVHKVHGSTGWVTEVENFAKAQRNRVAIVIADNAESDYFRQGLVEIPLVDYMNLQNDPNFMTMVAQKLVSACRNRMRSCLILLLTNNKEFAKNLQSAVDLSHKGLMETHAFPAPLPKDKEDILRVNVNRLNSVSYWFCIDRAGPTEKLAVYNSIKEASSFREAFGAIDNALNSDTRPGRPANKNLITLVIIHSGASPIDGIQQYGALEREEFNHKWASSYMFSGGWAQRSLSEQRDCQLLESEWQLRIVALGEPFAQALLLHNLESQTACINLFEKLKSVNGPGTPVRTRETFRKSIASLIDRWPNVTGIDASVFWNSNQNRSVTYEPKLSKLLPGYNTTVKGFLRARPDFVIKPFVPCSVLSAGEADVNKINVSIKRGAHVFEFTSSKDCSIEGIARYMRTKLPNYVELTQEQ